MPIPYIRFMPGSCECLFKGPAIKAFPEGTQTDADPTRPLTTAERFAVEANQFRPSGVRGLFCGCGPAAIARLIIAVIVNAINRVFAGWSPPHVVKESQERHLPSLAYSDASAAVQAVIRSIRFRASSPHRPPCIVFWSATESTHATAAATARLSASHVACVKHRGVPALAPAYPVCVGIKVRKLNNGQFPVDIPSQVFDAGRYFGRIVSSHLNLLCRFVVVRADPVHITVSACFIISLNT